MRNKIADLSIMNGKSSLNVLPFSKLDFIVLEYYQRTSPVPDNIGQTSVSPFLVYTLNHFEVISDTIL